MPALVGHKGAGRATLLKTLAGAERPDEGDVLREWAPATRPVAVPRPGSHGEREAAYTVLAASDALDTDPAGAAETTT